MKVIVNGLDLSNAVLKVSKALSAKTTNPILTGIKLCAKGDNLILSATDTEISIEKIISCETFMEGETVVQGKLFGDFINKLSGEEQVELSIQEDSRLKIVYNDSKSYMQTMDASQFPEIKKEMNDKNFTLLGKDFKSLINMTAFACSTDESRPILKGCLLEIKGEDITSVALDGFRLAVCRKKIKGSNSDVRAIVPARALLEITRLLEKEDEDVTLQIENNNLKVEVEGTILITRLLEGEYINYKQIIPTEFTTKVNVDKNGFEDSLERASVLAKSTKNLVKLDIKEKYINVTANSENGNVNENVIAVNEGKDLVIAFNSKYFTDCMKVISEEIVSIYFTTAIAPCVIKPQDESYLYLILPIRMNV